MAGMNGVTTTNKPTHFPFDHEVLGHVLDPAKGDDNEMAQWVLKANGRVVPHHTLCPLKPEEEQSTAEQKKCDSFDELIERRWGHPSTL